ncbi:MAG: hypothetical protein M3Y18_09165, partial [Candidatus Eremiobacteraeota bacterium]|nr:hypothetical protein [Candidatus Eremiobacteraeota bacterium]
IEELSVLSETSERQLRRYLHRDNPSRIRITGGENPQFDKAVRMSKALRKHSGFAHPLNLFAFIGEFKPHAWGAIGKMCAPGPSKAILKYWPAIQWIIYPKPALRDNALEILRSADFNECFDEAWVAWTKSETSEGFPDELRIGVEHAISCKEVRYWGLADDGIRRWADHVAENPQHYGRGMRFLDHKVQGIRDDFVRQLESVASESSLHLAGVRNFVEHAVLLSDEEREELTPRATLLLGSNDDWKEGIEWLE